MQSTKTIRVLLALALAPVLAAADSPALAPPVLSAADRSAPAPVLASAGTSAVPVAQAEPVRRGAQDGRRTMRRLPANLGPRRWGVERGQPRAVPGGRRGRWKRLLPGRGRPQLGRREPARVGQHFETGGGPIHSTIFVAGMFTAGRLAQAAGSGR